MRMRKKKWAQPLLESRSDVVIYTPSEEKGHWRDVIPYEKLHVEIGSGKGDYWIKMSELYNQEGWIGIEKNTDCAAIAVRKSEGNVRDNMKFIHDGAEDITEWFGEKEVDVLHLNFSDPWPKKPHAKRRLTYWTFLRKYETILKDDGMVILKTDNSGFFEFSVQSFLNENWKMVDFSVDFRRVSHEEDAITEYEQYFMDLGQPIYRVIFQKGGMKHE